MSARRFDLASAATLGFGFLISGVCYGRLPERVATHFDLAGEPNGWMSRPWAAFFLPVFATAIVALVRASYRLMPAPKRAPAAVRSLAMLTALLALFLVVLHAGILGVAIVPGFGIGRVLWGAVTVLWFSLALLLPRVERNPFVGVRTPWTLASSENWAKTHRVASYTFGAGAFGMLPAAVAPTPALQAFAMAALLVSAIVPALYSMVIAQRSRS